MSDLRTGVFSEEERQTIFAAADDWIESNGITEEQLQAWNRKEFKFPPSFFNQICDALPDRKRQSISDFILRNLGRHLGIVTQGKWTEDELRQLREFARGQQSINWGAIAGQLNRSKTQCRQRWELIRGLDDEEKQTGRFNAKHQATIVLLLLELDRQHIPLTEDHTEPDQRPPWSQLAQTLRSFGIITTERRLRVSWFRVIRPLVLSLRLRRPELLELVSKFPPLSSCPVEHITDEMSQQDSVDVHFSTLVKRCCTSQEPSPLPTQLPTQQCLIDSATEIINIAHSMSRYIERMRFDCDDDEELPDRLHRAAELLLSERPDPQQLARCQLRVQARTSNFRSLSESIVRMSPFAQLFSIDLRCMHL